MILLLATAVYLFVPSNTEPKDTPHQVRDSAPYTRESAPNDSQVPDEGRPVYDSNMEHPGPDNRLKGNEDNTPFPRTIIDNGEKLFLLPSDDDNGDAKKPESKGLVKDPVQQD